MAPRHPAPRLTSGQRAPTYTSCRSPARANPRAPPPSRAPPTDALPTPASRADFTPDGIITLYPETCSPALHGHASYANLRQLTPTRPPLLPCPPIGRSLRKTTADPPTRIQQRDPPDTHRAIRQPQRPTGPTAQRSPPSRPTSDIDSASSINRSTTAKTRPAGNLPANTSPHSFRSLSPRRDPYHTPTYPPPVAV